VDRLIEAFNIAFNGDKNIRLKIGGYGSEKALLLKLIEKYNLTEQVILLGELPQSKVKQEMDRCDCFVLGSDVETFGVVLIEAMAMGKPVIATKSGGPEDIVTPEVGLLVEKNINDIAEALKHITTFADNYNPDTIRNYVLDNYSQTAVSKRVTDLYREIYTASQN
jgi:glycosyltransferase involved in cell wall biosynthesis